MSKIKRSKLRRSFPKPFASDNIQGKGKFQGPTKSRVHPRYEGIVDYRQRGKALDYNPLGFNYPGKVYTKEEIREVNKQKPIPKMPETGYQILEPEDQSPPVFRVQELLETWQSDRLVSFNEFKYFTVLYQHSEITLKLFHSGLKRCFVREAPGITVRSIIYSTLEDAMFAFNRNKITWWEVLPS